MAGAVALLGFVAAPILVRVLTPGFTGFRYDLTVRLVRVLFPMAGVLVLSAWALGVLNSHRKFFLSYVAPVAWNAAMIVTLAVFGTRLAQGSLAVALAWGALVGGVLQFLVQVPAVLRLEPSLRVRWDTRLAGVRTAVRNAGPAIMGRGVVQLSGYVDLFLASFLATGSLAALGYAQTLYVLPVSLFGMSVAAAELPELARERGAGSEVLRARVNAGLERMAFYVVPSVVAFFAVGDQVVGALYRTGDFGVAETRWVWVVLMGYAFGLLASTGTRLFSSAYFALHDTRTPAVFAGARVAFAATAGVLLMVWLEPIQVAGRSVGGWGFAAGAGPTVGGYPLGVFGLTAAAGAGAWLEWVLLRRRLGRRIGRVALPGRPLARMVLAAAVAALAGRGVAHWGPTAHPLVTSLASLTTFGVVYLGLAWALGLAEARALWAARLGSGTSD